MERKSEKIGRKWDQLPIFTRAVSPVFTQLQLPLVRPERGGQPQFPSGKAIRSTYQQEKCDFASYQHSPPQRVVRKPACRWHQI